MYFIYLALSDQKQLVHQCTGVSHFATLLVIIYAGVFIQVWSPLPLCTELDPWAKQSSAIQPNITINAGSNFKNTFWSYFAALRGGFTCDECWYFIGFYFTITTVICWKQLRHNRFHDKKKRLIAPGQIKWLFGFASDRVNDASHPWPSNVTNWANLIWEFIRLKIHHLWYDLKWPKTGFTPSKECRIYNTSTVFAPSTV